jgi:hypothetical protein
MEVPKVKFIMADYVKGILDEAPSDMDGTAASPAANHLFSVNDKLDKINAKRADLYHQMTTKLLYLSKRARPDFQTAVFLDNTCDAAQCRRLEETRPIHQISM